MGINMDLVEHDLKGKNIEDPEIKGVWKDVVTRLGTVLTKGARKVPSEEMDATRASNIVAPTTPPPEPFNPDRMILGHSHAQEGMLDATRKMLQQMEAESDHKPVEEESLIERVVHDGIFKEAEIKEAIRILKKEGSVAVPNLGLVKDVSQDVPETPVAPSPSPRPAPPEKVIETEPEGDKFAGQCCTRLETMLNDPPNGPRNNDLEHVREIVKAAETDPEIAALWIRAKRGLEDRNDIYLKVYAQQQGQKKKKGSK
jgi:hypothetical protein